MTSQDKKAYLERYRESDQEIDHLCEELCDVSPILQAFSKKGTKPIPYRTEPYPLFKENEVDESSKKEEADRLRAEIYMRQMLRAGKNWGKSAK